MAQPEIAVLVTTFERPGHLRRVLASIAAQRGVAGAIEVVVTDDGSRDETRHIVRRFAASVGFPLRFTTHPHDGFHVARCRNEGVEASTAPYLLFLDGDCIIPPDHLRTHLDRRTPGCVMAGYPIPLNQALSSEITEAEARDGSYLSRVPLRKRLKMRWRHLRALGYSLIGHATRPKLLGGNLGIAREDYERINGYDENFRGWGCEDDDLRMRLSATGVRIASIAWWTNTYHLWHPKAPSAPATWRAGANVEYFQRPLRLSRCLAGMAKRRLQDLQIQIAGRGNSNESSLRLLPTWCRVAAAAVQRSSQAPEIEIAFAHDNTAFSIRAECRVLVIPPGQTPSRTLLRQADVIFADETFRRATSRQTFGLATLDATLQRQLGHLRPPEAFSRPASLSAGERFCVPAAA